MSRLALFCSQWRHAVVAAWLFALLTLIGGAVAAGSGFTEVTDLPDGEAARAYALLDPSGADVESGTIVWRTDGAAVSSHEVRAEVTGWLDEVAAQPVQRHRGHRPAGRTRRPRPP